MGRAIKETSEHVRSFNLEIKIRNKTTTTSTSTTTITAAAAAAVVHTYHTIWITWTSWWPLFATCSSLGNGWGELATK